MRRYTLCPALFALPLLLSGCALVADSPSDKDELPPETVVSSLRKVTAEQLQAADTPGRVLKLLRTELGAVKVEELRWNGRLVNSGSVADPVPAAFVRMDFDDKNEKIEAVGRMLHIVVGSKNWQTAPDRGVGAVSPLVYVGRDAFEYRPSTVKEFRGRLGSLTARDVVNKNDARRVAGYK